MRKSLLGLSWADLTVTQDISDALKATFYCVEQFETLQLAPQKSWGIGLLKYNVLITRSDDWVWEGIVLIRKCFIFHVKWKHFEFLSPSKTCTHVCLFMNKLEARKKELCTAEKTFIMCRMPFKTITIKKKKSINYLPFKRTNKFHIFFCFSLF